MINTTNFVYHDNTLLLSYDTTVTKMICCLLVLMLNSKYVSNLIRRPQKTTSHKLN